MSVLSQRGLGNEEQEVSGTKVLTDVETTKEKPEPGAV